MVHILNCYILLSLKYNNEQFKLLRIISGILEYILKGLPVSQINWVESGVFNMNRVINNLYGTSSIKSSCKVCQAVNLASKMIQNLFTDLTGSFKVLCFFHVHADSSDPGRFSPLTGIAPCSSFAICPVTVNPGQWVSRRNLPL